MEGGVGITHPRRGLGVDIPAVGAAGHPGGEEARVIARTAAGATAGVEVRGDEQGAAGAGPGVQGLGAAVAEGDVDSRSFKKRGGVIWKATTFR